MNILATLRCDLTSLTSVPFIPLWTRTSRRPFVVILPVWHLSPLYPSGHEHLGDPSLWSYQSDICPLYTPLDMNILATLRCDLTSLTSVPSGHEHLGDPSLWSYQSDICPLYTPLDMNISATLRCDLTSLTSVPFIPLRTWTSRRPFVVILPVWHLSPLDMNILATLRCDLTSLTSVPFIPFWTWTSWRPFVVILPVWHLSPVYPSGHEHLGDPSLWS